MRYAKKNPIPLEYKKLDLPIRVLAVADSGFTKREDDGLAVRGALFALANMKERSADSREYSTQFLEHLCGKQKLTTRSTWTAELHNQVDAADFLVILQNFFYELHHGPVRDVKVLLELRYTMHSG